MEKDQVHVALPERVTRGCSLPGPIDHAQVDHLRAEAFEPGRDGAVILLQPLPQTGELAPVGIQTHAEQAHPVPLVYFFQSALIRHS